MRARVVERIELYDPPAAPSLSGISFLEFAVDEASGRTLGALIENLGFRRAGKHRTKNVTLYRQGGVNLILNADPNSVARMHFVERGPSVCAIGLRTDDPVRALSRAVALQCVRFDSRIGPNEARIPAVRAPAPDSSVIYFVPAALGADGLFEIDFDLAGDKADANAGAGAGLKTIDHVAFGLPPGQLDTWVLFCRAVLGMKAGESLELSDPFGLIRSCGIATDDRSVRFVLMVSASQKTRTAQTVSASGGGGVHHIAVDCVDIFDTVAKLRGNSVPFVPVSPNYYDDITARLDIDAGLVEHMRSLGILYERNANGEYFHAYSTSFADRFFFEIVQRVGVYEGYGAGNAPARMASQTQAMAVEG